MSDVRFGTAMNTLVLVEIADDRERRSAVKRVEVTFERKVFRINVCSPSTQCCDDSQLLLASVHSLVTREVTHFVCVRRWEACS